MTDFSVNGNQEPPEFPVIAFTHWKHVNGRHVYVADEAHGVVLGGRVDWEYTEHTNCARPLNKYWWRRFRSDMHKSGNCAHWKLV
jgi:predicted double-glycine peptidase